MTAETVVLSDPASGAEAHVLTGYGFNCHRFSTLHNGQPVEALWSAPGFAEGGRASSSGIPLLFPFAGRIGGARYEFAGREYRLEEGDGRGNAIHGFVLNRPWQVVEQSVSRVVGRFQASRVDATLLEKWPADFVLTCAYELRGQTLLSDFIVENPDERPLPFGLGTHPYFRLPLGPRGQAANCRITVPIARSWQLVDMLPTGEETSGEVHERLRRGMAFGDTQFDDVFSGVAAAAGAGTVGTATARIDDPANGRGLRIDFDASFRECVVYNPPHREAICIEPYTCVPDLFRLAAAGRNTGLRVLAPGERFTARIAMTVEG